jgi:hypothetical protein
MPGPVRSSPLVGVRAGLENEELVVGAAEGHQLVVRAVLDQPPALGFAIGFVWLYERITPSWLIHIKGHNPYAERVYGRYVAHAEAVWAAREHKRARRAASTGAAARGRTRRST